MYRKYRILVKDFKGTSINEIDHCFVDNFKYIIDLKDIDITRLSKNDKIYIGFRKI